MRENFQQLYEVFIELYGEQEYFYFDEIQNIVGWETFVKRLYNQGKKVFITGSNARMLSKELGTLLTGCYSSIELYPFDFSEFLRFRKYSNLIEKVSGTVERGQIQALFEEYLYQGGFPFSGENGSLLENLVHLELRRRGNEIYYHHTANSECDFIVRDGFKVVQAIQVCYFMENANTRQRELKGIIDAMNHYDLTVGYIITATQEEEIQIDNKTIKILPCWRWLLETE